MTHRLLRLSFLLLVVALFSAQAFAGATIVIVNGNAAGVGFNDPTPAAPVGGNTGATLGQQRLNAFQHAANIWGANLDSSVTIQILATFEPLSCTATSATLGSAGTQEIFFFSSGDANVDANTLYPGALTNKFVGFDVSPNADIRARFNSNLGNPGCLTGVGWYLGFDSNHGTQIDLVTVLLHEFGHGLGFQQFASLTSGAMPAGLPDAYNKRLFDDTQAKFWPEMTNAQRVASSINFNHLVFTGSHVTDNVPGVLSFGLPGVRISAPASIAGFYAVGLAQFGAPVSSPGVSGQVVQALDASNASGLSTTDGCTTITNPSDVAGKIAIIDRGTCGFSLKVKNAQDAGAIAVIIADNAPGAPPAGMAVTAGFNPTITSVRVTQPDGNAIKARLAASETVTATIALDMSVRAGADSANHARINAPAPVQLGSSVSHYDPQASRNLLMEPAINGDLTHSVNPPEDLTRPHLRDIGWYPDGDLDFVADDNGDECLGSDLRGTIIIGAIDTGVPNAFFTNGCTITDLVNKCSVGAKNHGAYASCGSHVLDSMVSQGFLTDAQKDIVQSAVARNK